ncbi:MAG: hypothetical protein RQ758_01730 [Methanomicrobiaceae archaeon]|nr:hypothetical protein [Methanomicrobiaceae archaeon]
MNRKNLSIVVVAAVAIIIVAALILTGAGQTGPLSGDVGIPTAGPTPPTPIRTFLSLSFDPENCQCDAGDCTGFLTGTLLDIKGEPVAEKDLVLYCEGFSPGEWMPCFSVTPTQADGSFSAELPLRAGDMLDMKVVFPGDADHYPAEMIQRDVWCLPPNYV